MDSARAYTSVSTDAYSRTRNVTTMSAKDFMDSLNSAFQDVHKRDNTDEETKKSEGDKEALSDDENNSLGYLKGKFNEITASKVAKSTKLEEDLKSAIRYMILNLLLMLILGKNGGKDLDDVFSRAFSDTSNGNGDLGDASLDSLQFLKIEDNVSCTHYEAEFEATTFKSKGIVKTSDGRELDFNIDLTMSRSLEKYTKQQGVYESLGVRLCDPLVLNFDTPAANVSDQKFYFDLDADGEDDVISTLGAGSGFLALDLNEDGKINDGSELFGTKSGDGFKDLSKYDKDGNGWIDEADEIFDKLTIMCFEEDGSTTMYKLKDKNVGAIYLGNKDTEFDIIDHESMLNARIRKTGIFMYETGGAGTIQHVDLRKDAYEQCS